MSLKVSISSDEIEGLLKDFRKYGKNKIKEVGKRVIKGGLQIHTEARRDILVDTGRARSSTNLKINRDKGDVIGAEVTTSVNYAIYIERKKPYLYKAFAKERPRFIRDVKRIMKLK